MGGDILHGAGIGGGTALLYNLFKHQKDIVFIQCTELTFFVSQTLNATQAAATAQAS